MPGDEIGLDSGFTETGYYVLAETEEEKASAYEACTMFVLPSIYEPYGIVLLEAAAHGKPLISTRAGGPKSIVVEGINGLLVTPGANRELAAALLRLSIDKELAERMGEEARLMASEHTWERVARATERAYHSVDDRVLAGREIGW